ncbi:lipid droplet-regulating VLDL assembly factor AUP1-like [Mytilus californianus]|uniref:lipid droplet-regulating VLDL assembly factor AUP1-like n=1 Tax=Mytilus californianus TaxID=6549 RepID=UPI002247F079|nr:lipid droplet-regulating VLDL assembly factor AUP1-like [Mytilus californianus]
MDRLFDISRFPDPGSVVLTIFYFPFGLVLVIIRLFIALHGLLVSCILPKSAATSFILKSIFAVVGIHIMVQEDKRDEKKKAKILVANYISHLDHMIIDFIQPCHAPDYQGLSGFEQWIFAYKNFGISKGTDTFEKNIKEYVTDDSNKFPVLLWPEKTTTNGRKGLLKFDKFPFSCSSIIQPMTIQATRWPLDVKVTTLTSNRWTDFFWSMFFPYTIFKIKILPAMEKSADESVEEFADRVREKLSSTLNVRMTDYTFEDKEKYIKQLDSESKQKKASSNKRTKPNPAELAEVSKMAQQVKEVLPDTPLSVIEKDLLKTKDIDRTISNILEGKIVIPRNASDSSILTVPSSIPEVSQEIRDKVNTQVSPAQQKYSAHYFPKSSSDRHQSFEERKKIMIETARQRYIEKHGLH